MDISYYLNVLSNLESKLEFVRNNCGSGFLHDAMQNHRVVEICIEHCTKMLENIPTYTYFREVDGVIEFAPEECKGVMTKSILESQCKSTIKKAEDFLMLYAGGA